jgi:serine/threonine-protein kinase
MLRTVRPDTPPVLEGIVARATSRDPAARFASAAEMAAALSPLAEHATFTTIEPTRSIVLPDAPTTVIRREAKTKHGRGRVVAVVVAVLLTAAAIPLGLRQFAKVGVPRVAGLTQDQAVAAIDKAGLQAEPNSVYNATVPVGRVVSTLPAIGAHVRRGTHVTVYISLGPRSFPVPSLVGLAEADALKTLSAQHLKVAESKDWSPTVPKGHVISQLPQPPAVVQEGTSVAIVVSNGPQMIAVPDVRGQQAGDAKQALEDAGFIVAIAHVDSNVPRGQVATTAPAPGAQAAKGSTVTIEVSNGPKEFPAPDVRGESYDQAVAELATYGLNAARRQIQGSYGDTVISQVPEKGEKVKRGDTIILYTA